MNRKLITDMDTDENDDLSAVNMITLKKCHPNAPEPTHEVVKDIDLKEQFNVKKSKQQTFEHLIENYDNLVSYNDAKNVFLSCKETFPTEAALDLRSNTLFNVKDPTVSDQGANKRYVDSEDAKRNTAILKLNTTAQLKADKTDVDANNVRITNNTSAIGD